jgi:hypothetical protein
MTFCTVANSARVMQLTESMLEKELSEVGLLRGGALRFLAIASQI